MNKEDPSIHRRIQGLHDFSVIGMNNLCQGLAHADRFSRFCQGFKNTGFGCSNRNKLAVGDDLAVILMWILILDDSSCCQKIHHRHNCLSCSLWINSSRSGRIQGISLGIPNLPVVIQGCRIIGTNSSFYNIRKAEVSSFLDSGIALIHHSYMRHKITRHIEGSKLDSVLIFRNLSKNSICDSLCRFSQIIAGEHTVNVRIVRRPKPFLNIHRIGIYRRNDQNLMIRKNPPFLLQLSAFLDQLGAAVDLLNLIASHAADNTKGFFSLSEGKAGYPEIVPVKSLNGIKNLLTHSGKPPFSKDVP